MKAWAIVATAPEVALKLGCLIHSCSTVPGSRFQAPGSSPSHQAALRPSMSPIMFQQQPGTPGLEQEGMERLPLLTPNLPRRRLSQLSRLVHSPNLCPPLSRSLAMAEVTPLGACHQVLLTQAQFLHNLGEHRLPFRDLRALLSSSEPSLRTSHPALLPRPSSKCYIFEMEQIQLICFAQKCLVLSPERKVTQDFLRVVTNHLHNEGAPPLAHEPLHQGVHQLDFEHVVLEVALEEVVRKLRRQLHILRPALELLLHQVEQNPETNGLKRLLAVKKSLAEFEVRVERVMKVLRNLLADDADLLGLYLRSSKGREGEPEEVELLLSSYSSDLDELDTEVKVYIDKIEDTDQFISAHLDSVRNEIIKFSLFTEVGGLVLGLGAVIAGIFGMNLSNNMDTSTSVEAPWAFLVVCGAILVVMLLFFACFATKYHQLKTDTSSVHSFTLLKNFFSYVDDLELHIFDGKMRSEDLKESVEKVTGLRITERERELLLKMVEGNREGVLEAEREEALQAQWSPHSQSRCATFGAFQSPGKVSCHPVMDNLPAKFF